MQEARARPFNVACGHKCGKRTHMRQSQRHTGVPIPKWHQFVVFNRADIHVGFSFLQVDGLLFLARKRNVPIQRPKKMQKREWHPFAVSPTPQKDANTGMASICGVANDSNRCQCQKDTRMRRWGANLVTGVRGFRDDLGLLLVGDPVPTWLQA